MFLVFPFPKMCFHLRFVFVSFLFFSFIYVFVVVVFLCENVVFCCSNRPRTQPFRAATQVRSQTVWLRKMFLNRWTIVTARCQRILPSFSLSLSLSLSLFLSILGRGSSEVRCFCVFLVGVKEAREAKEARRQGPSSPIFSCFPAPSICCAAVLPTSFLMFPPLHVFFLFSFLFPPALFFLSPYVFLFPNLFSRPPLFPLVLFCFPFLVLFCFSFVHVFLFYATPLSLFFLFPPSLVSFLFHKL